MREKRSWSPSAASGTALTTSSLPAALKRRRVSWQDQQGEAEEVGSEDRHDASQVARRDVAYACHWRFRNTGKKFGVILLIQI